MASDWLGGGLIFALAAVLWLIYLIPTWFRRNEFLSTERNVVRLQQTLRILAETSEVPDEIHAEANARSVAEQQRLLKKANAQNLLAERAGLQTLIEQGLAAEAAADREQGLRDQALRQVQELEAADRAGSGSGTGAAFGAGSGAGYAESVAPTDSGDYETIVLAPTPTAMFRRQASLKLRRARAATSGILLLALVVTVLGAVQTAVNGAWIVLVVGAVATTLCVTRLTRLARDARALRERGPVSGAGAADGTGVSSRRVLRASGARPGYRPVDEAGLTDVDDLFADEVAEESESPLEGFSRAARAAASDDSGWTPVPLPKPLYVGHRRIEGGAPVAPYVEQTAERAEEALRAAARDSELALRAAQAATVAVPVSSSTSAETGTAPQPTAARPAAPSRFASMGVVDESETGAIDVDQVLARRRAG